MIRQTDQLELDRCPHCNVARPHLLKRLSLNTADFRNGNKRLWVFYECRTCGGVVMTVSPNDVTYSIITTIWPAVETVSDVIPERAHTYLEQAISSRHAPAGATMLAASAVDAMLKAKGLTDGSLYSRINKAASDHLITSEMAIWAHEVRLEANDQRHADEDTTLPSLEDADRVIMFARTLADFLFVLPDQVRRGRAGTEEAPPDA